VTMIASVLHLDRRAVQALRITDPYSLHRVVYSLYDDIRDGTAKASGASSGILYSDLGGDARGRQVLMLSNREPAKSIDNEFGAVQSKKISDQFLDHKQYRFKVVVNPVRRESASKKTIPIKGREAIAKWFAERAQSSWGFAVDPQQIEVNKIDVLQFKDKASRQVTLAQAHIQGVLTVTSIERFTQSFTLGIGRGKAFGCGLLQITPVLETPFT
jgi:CRISPR system Cascade subunit CasE